MKSIKAISYTQPSITALEQEYAADAVANGWGPKCYDYLNRFEAEFADFLDVEHAIATSSCTGAMHLGLAALGIGAGDEVVVADTNWIATVAPIVHLKATPVFVDVLPDSWCIDPRKVEAAITSRTRAIVAVHLYGNLCNMRALLAIGEKYGIPVIEDAAEAVGSTYFGRRAGSMGAFGVFSFHGTKTMTTGEGGMFVTNDSELFERVLTLSNHGRSRSQKKQFWPDVTGFKYKMSNVQAAIGCAQLERVEVLVSRKREILENYRAGFADLEGVSINPEPFGTVNGAWMPTIVFDESTGVTREKLQAAFAASRVDARVFFHPLSSLPMFTSVPSNTVAWDIPTRAINLPSFHDMTDAEQNRVIEIARNVYLSTSRTSHRAADIYGNTALFSQADGFVFEDLAQVAA